MRRRLLNALTLLSLMLAIAVAGLWVRSVWWGGDLIGWTRPSGWGIAAISSAGHVAIMWGPDAAPPPAGFTVDPLFVLPERTKWWGWRLPLFRGLPYIAMPDWALLVAFLLAPICWWWRHPARVRRKRLKLGLCAKCGYDLRGSKDKCPECGEPIRTATAAETKS